MVRMKTADTDISTTKIIDIKTDCTVIDDEQQHTVKYQWFYSESPDLSSPIKVDIGTYNEANYYNDMLELDVSYVRYYFLRVYVDDTSYVDTEACCISYTAGL